MIPVTFSVGPTDVLIWVLVGLVGGGVGSLVVRGTGIRVSDALLGIPGALLGGISIEWAGMRESGELVGAAAAAFFGALILTVLVRLLPWRFSA